ncbi:MAG: patatin-like phospholipase family protein [Lysobacteraceae bacterium]
MSADALPHPRPRVALALGSGGARGLAHIGAIEVLRQHDLDIVALSGSSMGALIGGIFATGRLDDYRDWVSALERGDVIRLLDFAFGSLGLIKGDRIITVMREMVGEHRIEDLPISYTAVATDIAAQREVWINRGPLFEAIRASIAIPMVFTPHRLGGRELVDGGLLAPVPVAPMRQVNADVVIAVDVNASTSSGLQALAAPPPAPPAEPVTDAANGNGFRARLAALFDGMLERPAPAPAQPGLMDLMSASLDTMQAQLSRLQLALDPPDLVIRIPRTTCMAHEFWRAREVIEVGREAAHRALASIGIERA